MFIMQHINLKKNRSLRDRLKIQECKFVKTFVMDEVSNFLEFFSSLNRLYWFRGWNIAKTKK